MSSQPKLMQVENINKTFPGVKALTDANLDIFEGEVHAIVGENGAGKSTLIKILTGAFAKDSGRIIFEGQEISNCNAHQMIEKGISCIYQELTIVPLLDVAKNIFLGNLPMKKVGFYSSKTLYSEATNILKIIGLETSPKTLAKNLTIAQQQMVEIGRAISRKAKIIIMDEPTSSLTEKETGLLFKIIRELKGRGISVIYVSHKLEEVKEIADRITVFRDGYKIATINTCDVTREQIIEYMIGRSLENYFKKEHVEISEPVLRVEGLSRADAFKDISFEVRKGEILGFFGLIGAGRTEIMRAIFGVDKYESGKICIGEKEVAIKNPRMALQNGIFLVPEDRRLQGLILRLSVLVNMTLVKIKDINKFGHINKKTENAVAKEYISYLNIKTPSFKQVMGNLSGGNQQKVAIAKWLMVQPKVLILDEPTRGIDVASKSEIYGLIGNLAKKGVAVIVVSSEMPEIMGICDRIITVYEGRITGEMDISEATSTSILDLALGGCK